MRRTAFAALAAAAALGTMPSAASAEFGVKEFKAEVRKSSTPGDLQTQAGSVPFEGVTDFTFNTTPLGMPDGAVKNIRVDLPPGLVSNPQSTPKCTDAQFPDCPANTQLGTEDATTTIGPLPTTPVYNMVPRAGQVSLFSFNTALGRTDIVGGVRPNDYGLFFTISDVPENANLTRSVLTFFGTPANRNGGGGKKTFFIRLPTACIGPQTTKLTVTSYAGETATKTATTPVGASGCDSLAFAPKLTAVIHAGPVGKPAGLTVAIAQADGEANIKTTSVRLPRQLGARLDTIAKACPEATFKADLGKCGAGSKVGTVKATTVLLANALAGDVLLESHTAGALPTLEALLKGPGFTVGLSGSVNLSNGITSTFDNVPDLPISSFTLDLPAGPGSALTASGDLCAAPLTAAYSMVAHSGKKLDAQSPIAVIGCGVKIVASKVKRLVATLTIRAPARGVVVVTGKGVKKTKASFSDAGTTTAKLKLNKVGAAGLERARKRHRKLTVRVKAVYVPAAGVKVGGEPVGRSSSIAKLVFKAR